MNNNRHLVSTALLLDRSEQHVYGEEARSLIAGKVILVTGAGGSIGSEIVRQVRLLGAAKVIFVDNDEYALYNLDLELNGSALLSEECFVLGSVSDRADMKGIFERFRPEIVFHAAAHKHLPLTERAVGATIRTNVLGSDLIAELCVAYGAERLINISTDKAARPSSVLGMTKRLAELAVALRAGGRTRIASVRFGNVLGSRGSFLETLRHLIDNDLTLTITDPQVERYFMTIPEAAGLVIEAAVMADKGETFILDMGQPIRILDLVERYVSLTGCKFPSIDFIGLRPGEKLSEILFDPSEVCAQTIHSRISTTRPSDTTTVKQLEVMALYQLVNEHIDPNDLRQALASLITPDNSRF